MSGRGGTAYARLIDALHEHGSTVRGNGVSAKAQCPAHVDSNPSLSLRPIEGQALIHCFAGCDTADVLAALNLGMSALYDEPAGARYDYTDIAGTVLRTVHRTPDKRFRQSGQTKGTATLYRLPQVLEGVAGGDTIYLTEGEKDVLALESIGAVATTSPMGAANWHKVDHSPLTGAHVVVVPDLDTAGKAYTTAVVDSLRERAASVRVASPKVGKDAANHVAAGHGLDDLVPVDLQADGDATVVSGDQLLTRVETFLGRFIAYPSDAARVAHTLWITHTHLMGLWESTPRIAFLSPEPSSGKSRCLEVSERLVPRPVHAVNTTPAYLFRKVSDEAGPPTILYDEIDTIFGPKAKDNEDIRGMLNAGHRRGALAGRCVVKGKIVATEELPAYCAVALAGLNDLPDTIMTRSVVIRMRRRAPAETIEPWRLRINGPEADGLHHDLATWATAVADNFAWPDMPAGIQDRNADVWEALLAVADMAGGDWPERARVSAVSLVTCSMGGTPSLGVQLLRDLRAVFADQDRLPTETILTALHKLDESPWGDLRGKPIDSRWLSRHLSKYEVRPKVLRFTDGTHRGYEAADLTDPFSRYVTDETEAFRKLRETTRGGVTPNVGVAPQEHVTTVTTETSSGGVAQDDPELDADQAAVDRAGRLVQDELGGVVIP